LITIIQHHDENCKYGMREKDNLKIHRRAAQDLARQRRRDFMSVNSLRASAAIQRADFALIFWISRAHSTARRFRTRFRFPIWRRAQLTAFFTNYGRRPLPGRSGQKFGKKGVIRLLVVDGQARHEDETRPFDEGLRPPTPGDSLL